MDKSIKKAINSVYSLLILEDLVSHRSRAILTKLFLSSSLVLFVASLFVTKEFEHIIKGFFALSLLFFLGLEALEAYFYSNYEKTESEYSDAPFEISKIMYYSIDNDLVKGFIFSEAGDEIMKRLGFSEQEIRDFIQNKSTTEYSSEDIFKNGLNDYSLYTKFLYDSDEDFRVLLTQKNIQYVDFFETFKWVIQKSENKIERERWWSKENLSKIEGIGKNWSYGETYTLQKYGIDITEVGSSHIESYEAMHSVYVDKLESLLSRARGANGIVVSDDEATRMDVVTMLARRIRNNKVSNVLQKKRVFVLNPNLLIENAGDKVSFERELSNVLLESIHALNVILVFPYFSSFLKSAESIGSDAISIIRPFLVSPVLNIIGLDSKETLRANLSNNSSVMENFEVINMSSDDLSGVMNMLKNYSEQIESQTGMFFTYPSIKTIAEGTKRYFDAYAVADKAKDLLYEAIPLTASKGRRVILKQDILELIESKTGVPTDTPKAEEREVLLNLEEILHKRIVGQDEAIRAISGSLKRSRAGIRNPDRPMGSFLFLGPTGVGKTETTKALADIFFGSEEKISRLDMSEYKNSDALSKLIGYFGNEDQGVLVAKVKDNPYGVMLLDEFEKTNNDVLNLFLQILDEGEFSDSKGRKINVKNNIIIATSNAGSELLWNYFKEGKNPSDHKDEVIDSIIQAGIFKPELLNRFDGIILFHPLNEDHLRKIAELMVKKLQKRMNEKGLVINIDDNLINFLVKKGADPKFGARPMNRAIQDDIEQIIAEKIIAGEVSPGSRLSFAEGSDSVLQIQVNEAR